MEDIKKNGLQEKIWTYKGQIIDGRHRYLACKKFGIEPMFREWDGKGSLRGVRYVICIWGDGCVSLVSSEEVSKP